MDNEIQVQLGVAFSNFTYHKENERLYVSGPALEEGTWSGLDGHTFFYPKDVIQASASGFKNVDIVCEHLNIPIGKVTDVVLTDSGFAVKDAYIFHKPSIDAILSGDKRGFSIKASVFSNDPIKRIVNKIYHATHLALVANPACAVCNINHMKRNDGTVIMSEEVIEGVETDTIAEVKDEVVLSADTDGKVEDIVVADATPPAEGTLVEDTPVIEVVADVVVEPVAVSLSESTEIDDIKVALSAATETMAVVSKQLMDISTKLQETEVSLSATKDELVSTKVELSAVKEESNLYKAELTKLQDQIKATELIERNAVISEIKGLDPDVDSVFIESMSTVQLSAYKGSIARFASKGVIDGERKAVKVDEEVSLSAPIDTIDVSKVPDKHALAAGINAFLRRSQT